MRKVLFFLLGLLVLTGCSTEEESDLMSPPDVASEVSVDATRAFPDSLAIALENSVLLQDLNAYNDSIIASTIQTRAAFGWLKKLVRIAKADLYGFAGGMGIGTLLTSSPIVGAVVGVVSGASYSAIAAKEKCPSQIIKRVPTSFDIHFNNFDNYTYQMQTDINFSAQYNTELISVGDISKFGNLKTYLSYGVQHNLTLDKFRKGTDPDDLPSVSYAIPNMYRGLIYSNPVMSQLSEGQMDALDDNLKWDNIFCNRQNMTQTYSQGKAAAVAREFEELIDNAYPGPDFFDEYTLYYMKQVNNSQEIEEPEKTILLNMLPVYMYSINYWNRNLIEED